MPLVLPINNFVGLRKGGHLFPVDIVPTMGNIECMTLREYFKTGKCDMATMAYAVGVSEHAVHKWTYGQRAPHLKTALAIVEFTKGKVKLTDLLKDDREKAA